MSAAAERMDLTSDVRQTQTQGESAMAGYAVVDLETTGLFPGGHDRIVEVGVVLVSPDGEVEDIAF